VLQDQLLEEEHVALQLVRNGVLAHLHLASLHVGGKAASALVALHPHDLERHQHVFGHQHAVQHLFLDVEVDFELCVRDVGLDPARFDDFDELECVEFGEAELQQFARLGLAVEPLVVLVQLAVALSALVHRGLGGDALRYVDFLGQTHEAGVILVGLDLFAAQAAENVGGSQGGLVIDD